MIRTVVNDVFENIVGGRDDNLWDNLINCLFVCVVNICFVDVLLSSLIGSIRNFLLMVANSLESWSAKPGSVDLLNALSKLTRHYTGFSNSS